MTTEHSSDTYYDEYFSYNQKKLKCAQLKVGVIQCNEYNAIQGNIGTTIYPPMIANAARSSFLACSASS